MKKIKRVFRYFVLHSTRNTKYFFTYLIHFFDNNYVADIKYYDLDDLENLLKKGKSIIRIGDGEIYIMNFGSIHYQKYDERLRSLFFKMINEYNEDSQYVLSLNKIPLEKSNIQLKKDGLLNCWLPMKVYYQLYFTKTSRYIDQVLFYYNETFPKYFESYLKTKHLVLVSHQGNIDNFKNNPAIPFTDVSFVVTPAENAFVDYEKIKTAVRVEIDKHGKEKTVILAACGPASKPLAYELSKESIVTIDVGRGIEAAYTDDRIDQIIYPTSSPK